MPTGALEATAQSGLDFITKPGDTALQEQTDEERNLVKSVWQMLLSGKKYRTNWDKHWEKWFALWESQHWQRPKFSISQATVNLTHRAVETFLGNITDNFPSPKPQASRPEHQASASVVRAILDYAWRRNNGVVSLRRPIRSSLICGIGWVKVDWDPSDLNGKGDVRFTPRDARSIWVSPHAEDPWLRDALYVIEARNVPREYVARQWPRGNEVPSGVWDGTLGKLRTYFSATGVGGGWNEETLAYFQTTDGKSTQGSFSMMLQQEKQGLVTLLECWVRQDDGTIRYIVVANGVVLQDGPSPYSDELYPYVPYLGIRTDDAWYPRGVIQFIENLQYEMNELHSYALDIIHYMSDQIIVMDEENLESGAKVENIPGAIFPKIRGSEIRYLESPGLKPEIITMQEQVKSYFDDVLGNIDILSGIRPEGVTTLGGLEVLREQANVRLRMMNEDFKQSNRLLFQLILSRFRQFADDERILRVGQGKEGQGQFIELNKIVGFSLGGTPLRENVIPEDAEYEIEFDTAPGGPVGKRQKRDEALTLLQAGVIDQAAVLEAFEVENREEIIARMGEAQAAEAQAIAQAEAQKAGVQPPPGGLGAAPTTSANPAAEAMSLLSELTG